MQEVWVTNAVLMLTVFMLLMVFYVTGELTSNGFNYEVQALMDIKMQLIDPQNALSNWDSFAVDPCSWFHVTCSVEQSVINLGVGGFGLSGTLSSSVGNLSNLESLSLENNNLAGRLPPELGKLVKLSSLDLCNNHLSGEIPQTLGQMKSLSSLRLNNNNLSGDFPSSLVNIPRLDYVDLSNNDLSGHVPPLSATTLNIVGNPQLCGYPAYQKCSGDAPLPMMAARKGTGSIVRSRKIAIAVGTTGFSLIVLFLFAAAILWRRQHNQQIFYDAYEQQGAEVALGQLKRFSFRELQIATDNFHIRNILGRGGFGNVYKSRLSDGSLVAVKRLKDRVTAGGELQFQMEMEIISLAVHKNLLRLLGYCVTSTERLLIYPYMPNGSVASRLREKPALDWHTRKRIALGAARGLLYLHEQCDPKIIHRDVKAANILLDEDYEAVVGDFGLAKLLDHKESHVTTVVRGTVGHIAPEYLSKGQSSEKTDVFGFGILLLELIVGDFGHLSNKKGYVLLECVKRLQQEKRLIELVDPEIKANYNTVELEQVVQVALLCTQFSPVDRPKMSEVLQMLAGEGLAEHWDAWQRTETSRSQLGELRPPRYFNLIGDSSCSGGLPCTLLQASELSGPR